MKNSILDKSATSLIVVDMQPQFESAKKRECVTNCIKQVKRAIKENAFIIFLEFGGFGDTHPRILKAIQSYANKCFIIKYEDCGSDQVRSALEKNKVKTSSYIMCGVNTCACVLQTLCGMLNDDYFNNAEIKIAKDACNDSFYGYNTEEALNRLQNAEVYCVGRKNQTLVLV